VNADSKDGINIFLSDDDATLKFANFPNVEVSKFVKYKPSSVIVDMFPGEVHKPTITMAGLDNFVWGDLEPEP